MSSTLRAGQYVHYVAPQHQVQQPQSHQVPQQLQQTTVSPQDTQHHHVVNSHLVHGNTGTGQQNTHPQPPQQQQQTLTVPRAGPAVHNSGTTPVVSNNNANASGSGSGSAPVQIQPQPVVAKGNWTKDLVQLAKTAELKKHALTLQLHTAHILSAHASLEQKNRAVQDIKEQRNKLESERARLIECLSQVNEDRNQADLLEVALERERAALRAKINALSEAEYKVAKADVDRLRADLGQPPLPSLQETLDGKGAGYLTERRTAGPSTSTSSLANANGAPNNQHLAQNAGAPPAEKKRKRAATNANANVNANGAITSTDGTGEDGAQAKRPRGRPRGSRNSRGGTAGG